MGSPSFCLDCGRPHGPGHLADQFELARLPVRRHRGRHNCIGAPLARTEGAAGLKVLYSRIPALRVPEQPMDFFPMALLPMRQSLHVTWEVPRR
jgi:cytochrome P450